MRNGGKRSGVQPAPAAVAAVKPGPMPPRFFCRIARDKCMRDPVLIDGSGDVFVDETLIAASQAAGLIPACIYGLCRDRINSVNDDGSRRQLVLDWCRTWGRDTPPPLGPSDAGDLFRMKKNGPDVPCGPPYGWAHRDQVKAAHCAPTHLKCAMTGILLSDCLVLEDEFAVDRACFEACIRIGCIPKCVYAKLCNAISWDDAVDLRGEIKAYWHALGNEPEPIDVDLHLQREWHLDRGRVCSFDRGPPLIPDPTPPLPGYPVVANILNNDDMDLT